VATRAAARLLIAPRNEGTWLASLELSLSIQESLFLVAAGLSRAELGVPIVVVKEHWKNPATEPA